MCNTSCVMADCHVGVALTHIHAAAATFPSFPSFFLKYLILNSSAKLKKYLYLCTRKRGIFRYVYQDTNHAEASSCTTRAFKQLKVIFLTTIKHK